MRTVDFPVRRPGSSRVDTGDGQPPQPPIGRAASSTGVAVRVLRRVATLILAGMVAPALSLAQPAAGVQPSASNRVVIVLANANNPTDLDYQGGECEIDAAGTRMECGFQQVFLTMSPLDSQTCLITTNQYGRIFQKQSPTRWVSSEGPEGQCGLLDVATLEDEGNMTQWSLELRTVVTRKDLASCGREQAAPERLSWRNARRRLPCQFIQPGAIRP